MKGIFNLIKKMKYQNYIFSLVIFGLCLLDSKAEPTLDIHFIISYKANGTAAFAPLEYSDEKEKYVYFSFDFKLHNEIAPESINNAYFFINSGFQLNIPNSEKIKFGFSEKIWNEITSKKDLQDIDWKTLELNDQENVYNHYNYYFKIVKNDAKMNSLLIRIPKYGRKKGYLTVGNEGYLPIINKN